MATSSGLPGRILSRLWRLLSLPLVLFTDLDLWTPWRGGRPPRGFWSEARTGKRPAPKRPPTRQRAEQGRTTAPPPPPPPTDPHDYFPKG